MVNVELCHLVGEVMIHCCHVEHLLKVADVAAAAVAAAEAEAAVAAAPPPPVAVAAEAARLSVAISDQWSVTLQHSRFTSWPSEVVAKSLQ